jgi:hypothetical protein
MRWQLGVLVPPGWADGIGEHSWNRTQILAEAGTDATLRWRVRFLHAEHRCVEVDDGSGWSVRDRAEVGGVSYLSSDEAVTETLDLHIAVADLARCPQERVLDLPETEVLHQLGPRARQRRRREPLRLVVGLRADSIPGAIRWTPPPGASREDALRHSLIGCHGIGEIIGGRFVSLLEPPAHLADAAAACDNVRTWPVLAGPAGTQDVILTSPLILYDHLVTAPESPAMISAPA